MEDMWQKEAQLSSLKQQRQSLVQNTSQLQEGLKDQIETIKKSTEEAKQIAENFAYQKELNFSIEKLQSDEALK